MVIMTWLHFIFLLNMCGSTQIACCCRSQGYTSKQNLKSYLEREWANWLVMQSNIYIHPNLQTFSLFWHWKNLQGCILDCAEMMDVVVKKGSWYSYGDHRFAFKLVLLPQLLRAIWIFFSFFLFSVVYNFKSWSLRVRLSNTGWQWGSYYLSTFYS